MNRLNTTNNPNIFDAGITPNIMANHTEAGLIGGANNITGANNSGC